MHVLLDHLTAVIVGTLLLGTLLLLRIQDQTDAIETVQRYRAVEMASGLVHTLEREIENARGRDETERVFATDVGGPPLSPDQYRFRLLRGVASDGTEFTRQLTFPTVFSPDDLSASPLGIVAYVVEETGETAVVDGRERPLLRARRFEFPRGGPIVAAGVYDRLLDFDVTAYEPDGTEVHQRIELPETPLRIHIDLRFAPEAMPAVEGQDPTATAFSTRHARTVRVHAATAYERDSDILTGPGGIPPLPGDDDYVPPPGESDPGEDPGRDAEPGGDVETRYTICHNPGPDQRTITIVAADAPRHRAHGDHRGACH